MTYVTEQTSAELRAHMRRLKAMAGWHEPLADRLFKEVLELDAEIKALRAALRSPDDWKIAVLDALAGTCMDAPIGTPPREILKRVIEWHVQADRDLNPDRGAQEGEPSDAADAARYRWLRSTTNAFTNDAGHRINVKLHPEAWDAAIDAALAQGDAALSGRGDAP